MKGSTRNFYTITLIQLFLPLLLLWLSRFVFAWYCGDYVGNPSPGRALQLSWGGVRFDLCAWAYFNAAFIIMRFLPFDFVTKRAYFVASNVIWCVTNCAMLIIQLGDTAYFPFSGSRLRMGAVKAMLDDPNMLGIITSYAGNYLWAFLSGILLIALFIFLAFKLKPSGHPLTLRSRAATYAARTAIFLAALFLTFCAMRGNLGSGRPISLADAVWYTDRPAETNIVLNSPFTLLRSGKGEEMIEPVIFMADDELAKLRKSEHPALPDEAFTRKNVVLITLESGSLHWLDRYSRSMGAEERHLMPFLDSLSHHSLVHPHVMATARLSIEGITCIYGGFPTFDRFTFMSSPYAASPVDSHASLLRRESYATRFYFGGNHGSYSIDAFAKAMGYDDVVDRDTYNNDADFDGSWGIFDDAMGEYAARDLSTLPQPFAAGWFTLNLHEPFTIPDSWDTSGFIHKEPGRERSAEYTDRAIRRFFEIARTQPWYHNTVFVITGDHGSRDFKGTILDSPFIQPHVMFMAYTPDGSIAPGEITGQVASQIDVGPTILSLLHYPKSYVALGSDMLDTSSPHYGIGYFQSQYMVFGPRYLITLSPDCRSVTSVYDIVADPAASKPVSNYDRAETDAMLRWAQAFLQDYTARLTEGRLSLP